MVSRVVFIGLLELLLQRNDVAAPGTLAALTLDTALPQRVSSARITPFDFTRLQ